MWTTGFPKGPHRRCFKASSDRRLAAEPTGFVTPRLPALASPFRGSGDAHRHVRLWASGIYGWGVSQSTKKCGWGHFFRGPDSGVNGLFRRGISGAGNERVICF